MLGSNRITMPLKSRLLTIGLLTALVGSFLHYRFGHTISRFIPSVDVGVRFSSPDHSPTTSRRSAPFGVKNASPKVILHIGPHKTGTSSLQQFLKIPSVREVLSTDNVSMPTLQDLPGGNKKMPVFNFAGCMAGFTGAKVCRQKTLPAFARYTNRTFHQGKDILIVAEDMDRIGDLKLDLLRRVVLPYTDIQIVVTYRRLPDWFRSWYNEISSLYQNVYISKKRFPSFDGYLHRKSEKIFLRHTMGLEETYRNKDFPVTVLHYHRPNEDILENLFCTVLKLPNTCGALTSGQIQRPQRARSYHPHAFEICRWVWSRLNFQFKKRRERQCGLVSEYYLAKLKSMNISIFDFPLIWMSPAIIDLTWNRTVQAETRYFAQLTSNNEQERSVPTTQFWSELRAEFDKAIHEKWFTIDLDELNRTKQFDDILGLR